MRNNKLIILAGLVLCISIIGGLLYLLVGRDRNSDSMNNNESIVIKGKNITISEEEIKRSVEHLTYLSSPDPINSAVQGELEEKVLYYQATKMGYVTTEEEVQNEISEMKEELQKTHYFDIFNDAVNYYGSEEAYWNSMKDSLPITLTINKYLDGESIKYLHTDEKTNESKINNEEGDFRGIVEWFDERNKLKEDLFDKLISEENIEVLDDEYKDLPVIQKYIQK